MEHSIKLNTKDFLTAIAAIKPSRITKRSKAYEMHIAYLKRKVVFAAEAKQTAFEALEADWEGDVSLNFGAVLSFLTIKPVTEQILLVYKDNKIKIGTLTLPAKWTSLPAWLA